MTKEEILWLTPTIDYCGAKWHGRIGVEMAMDEYAKQQSIDFAKWIHNGGWVQREGGKWGNLEEGSKTPLELYEKYLQSKEKQ